MHAQLLADQDVDLSYHVRDVWMPEEASVEILVDSLRVYQTDQRCLSYPVSGCARVVYSSSVYTIMPPTAVFPQAMLHAHTASMQAE